MAANKLLLKALEDGDEAGYNRYGCPQLWVESVLPLVATTWQRLEFETQLACTDLQADAQSV